MRMRLLLAASVSIGLAGCAGPDWVKPGAGAAERDRAKQACAERASALAPGAAEATAPGDAVPTPASAECSTSSYGAPANCTSTGRRVPKEIAPAEPGAGARRAAAFEGCMSEAGFTLGGR